MMNTLRSYAVAAAILGTANASAGGLWLNEFGDFAGGRAAAGAAAGVDEAITILYNPASISRIKEDSLFVSGGAVITDIKFDQSYSTPLSGTRSSGDAGAVIPAASSAYVYDLDSDRWSVGIALGGISGAVIDYNDDWAGRYQATKVSLELLVISPTVAYQVTDRLSLGASLQGAYADLKVDLAVPRRDADKPDGKGSIDGNDFEPAFTLGAMYELSPRTRFGLFYQSEINAKFDGDLKLRLQGLVPTDEQAELSRSVSTSTKLDFAEYVRFAVHQDMDERWGVDFTVGWDNWSRLNDVPIATDRGTAGIPADWRDTFHVAWGAQYKLDEYWEFTGGVAYDSNPVNARHRNAQLPVDRQIRYAVGTRYKLRNDITVGGYVNFADLGDARINAKNFGGDYENNSALALVANLSWTF